MIPRPIEIQARQPYKIWLKYADGTSGELDLEPLKLRPPFASWDRDVPFSAVHLNPETCAVAWNELIELCPNTLYLKLVGKSFEEWRQARRSYASN